MPDWGMYAIILAVCICVAVAVAWVVHWLCKP